MASLTGQLVAETYKALLKLIDNDILTASEKQITDGFGGGSNVFIDSQGFLRANKYKVTNGLATQFLKADGSLDSNAYLTSITGAQVITALGYTPVPTTRTITINGETHNLAADNSWTVGGTAAIWGNITGILSNQTDLQNALNAKYNNPTGTISQYIRGDGTLATFPTMPGGLPTGGSAGQILAKIDATDYNTHWIDNYATQTKNDVKLGQTLTKGTPVYVSSANGTNMIVSRASNTSEALSSKTFGLLESGGTTNDIVKCVTFGLIAGLDTSTAQAGDPVWLGVNGALIFGLANKPYAPAHLVYIGVVTRVQQNNGEIFVNIQNGFELKEIHDVYIADPANNHGLFYDIADGLWKNKSIVSALGYTPQAQLSGTGFVKASGTTITYDNSTYLTTTDAASTYQRLDKMVSNLLPSATEYPNSNAVIAALALKADAANPVFTGNMTISGAEPKLYFTDTDQNPDYFIGVDAGFFRVYDQTAGATRFVINSDGNISTGVGKSITTGSFIKDGGTATQFLKADGSVDSTVYATSASLANYLLIATAASTYQTLANLSTDLTASATKYPSVNAVNTGLGTKQPLDADLTAIAALTGTTGFLKKTAADTWTLDTSTYLTTGDASTTYLAITTAASTYQRLDKMVSNLLPSSTEYPNSNAVINALALKADAANPVFTGNMTISGATPRLYFVDTDQNPDYTVFIDSGYFYIYDQTAGATRFSINSSGNINTGVGKSITAGSFIKESGTSSQYLMADGSVSTLSGLVTGSGTGNYITKWATGSTVGNSIIYDNGSSVGIGGTTLTKKLEVITGNGVTDGIRLTYANGVVGEGVDITYLNTGATTTSFDSLYNSAAAVMQFRMKTAATAVTAISIFGTGNVMIGTTVDQGFKLAVNGTARFYDNLQFSAGDRGFECSGSGGVSFYSNEINSGSQGVAGDLYLGYRRTNRTYIISPLTVSSAATFNSSISASNLFLNGTDSGGTIAYFSSNINGLPAISGTAQPSAALRLRGGDNAVLDFGLNSVNTWIQATDKSALNNFYNILLNPRGGNVGIGTTTDSGYKLEVSGQARFNSTAGNQVIAYYGLSDYLNIQHNGLTTKNNQMNLGTNLSSTPTMVLRDDLVGIGTTNPALQLSGTKGLSIVNSGNPSIGISNGTNHWLNYLTGSNYRFWNNTSNEVMSLFYNGNVSIGAYNDAGYKFYVSGQTIAVNNGTTAEIRLQGGSYGTSYNTSLRSLTGAIGVLQFGNNADNYILVGNTLGGGYLDVRVNCASESIASGSLALRIASNATATFYSSVTATSFFESSDLRLKTLIESNPIIDGIEKLEAKLYEKNGKIELGYFAQDAELIMPYAVTKNADGFLNLSYREVHTAKIARLEQRVAELEKQLNIV